ncbi:MAG: hypothetical protein ACQESU_01415 [Halobacteriota archaeon]
MNLSYTDMKKGRILLILVLSIAFVTTTVFVASAATTFDVQDSSGDFTFRFTFPNGEGTSAEPGYKINGID